MIIYICCPVDLRADEVGDLDVVLGPDAGHIGGEEHGGPGQGDKEPAGGEKLKAVRSRSASSSSTTTTSLSSTWG